MYDKGKNSGQCYTPYSAGKKPNSLGTNPTYSAGKSSGTNRMGQGAKGK